MSPFDCDLDFDAPRGLPDDQYSSIELARIFGGDDPQEPMEAKENDGLYEAALQWARRGYNVVPQKAPDQKHPGVKWKDFQERRVTKDELLDWHSKFANGVGFITGAISGVIVIETDGPEGEALLDEFQSLHGPLPATLVIRSGSGRGLHRHFKHPGYEVTTRANPAIKIDVKGDRGFCVLPPSKHKSGGRYEMVHDAEPAALPQGLLEFIEAAAEGKKPAKAVERAQGTPKVEETREWVSALGEIPEHIAKWFAEDSNIPPKQIDKPPPPAETMREILQHLNARDYFAKRGGIERDEAGHIVAVGWRECGMALKAAYGEDGIDLWDVTHVDERARTDAPTQWASFAAEARAGDVTIATIIKAAKDTGFVMPGPGDGATGSEVVGTEGATPNGLLDLRNGKIAISTAKPPPRDWTVDGRLLSGKSAILGGFGGVSKTQLAIQLSIAIALASPFMGKAVKSGGVMLILGEEDRAEITRRVSAVVRHERVNDEEIQRIEKNMLAFPLVGQDTWLTFTQQGALVESRFVKDIVVAAKKMEDVRLIVLDHLALIHGGEFNSREDAALTMRVVNHIAQETGASVLVLAHTPKSANQKEDSDMSMVAGSTAFVDQSRGVWVLATMRPEEAKRFGFSKEELQHYASLAVVKNNYGPTGEIVWFQRTSHDGVGLLEHVDLAFQAPAAKSTVNLEASIVGFVRNNPGQFSKSKLRDSQSGKKDGPLKASKGEIERAVETTLQDGRLVNRKPSDEEIKKYGLDNRTAHVLDVGGAK